MRLYPLTGEPLALGYLFASHLHIRAGLVSGGHATVPVTLSGVPYCPHTYVRGTRTARRQRGRECLAGYTCCDGVSSVCLAVRLIRMWCCAPALTRH